MFNICFILILSALIIFVLYKHKTVLAKRHEALAKHFNGKISSGGDSVDFNWQGIKFSATRLASGGGMAGTGSYGSLLMSLSDSEDVIISLDHIQNLNIQASEETKKRLLDAITSDKDLESRLKESLVVGNSKIQCYSRTDIDGATGLKKVHFLSILGLSVPYLVNPSSLENEIDTLIILARVLELNPTA
jgi:hypothetical protein